MILADELPAHSTAFPGAGPERNPHVFIGPADPLDCHEVASGMRRADRDEIAFCQAIGPEEAIRRSRRLSHECWAGRWDGVAVCIFGLGVGCELSRIARPWLLGTGELNDRAIATAFLRRNRFLVERWRAFYRLENWVLAENEAAVRWLGWLGFTLDAPAPFGPFKVPFRRFSMERY